MWQDCALGSLHSPKLQKDESRWRLPVHPPESGGPVLELFFVHPLPSSLCRWASRTCRRCRGLVRPSASNTLVHTAAGWHRAPCTETGPEFSCAPKVRAKRQRKLHPGPTPASPRAGSKAPGPSLSSKLPLFHPARPGRAGWIRPSSVRAKFVDPSLDPSLARKSHTLTSFIIMIIIKAG